MASGRCFREPPASQAAGPIFPPPCVPRINPARLLLSQRPAMISAPPTSAPGGYTSAVSMKLIPASAALSSIRCASFSSVCFPNVPVPRIMRETVRPVLPNFENCIGLLKTSCPAQKIISDEGPGRSVRSSARGLRRGLHGSVKQIHHEELEDGDKERPSAFPKIMLKQTDSGVQKLHGAGERTQDQQRRRRLLVDRPQCEQSQRNCARRSVHRQ